MRQVVWPTGGSPGRLGEVQIWDIAERKLRVAVPVTYDTVYVCQLVGG